MKDSFGKNFDRNFNRLFKLAFIGIVTMWVVGLAIVGALGYVAYKVLVHFSIL